MMRRVVLLSAVSFFLWGCSPSEQPKGPGEKDKAGKTPPAKTEPPGETPAGPKPTKDTGTKETPAVVAPGKLESGTPWRRSGDDVKVPGAVQTESGLEYAVLKEGSGASPSDGAKVKVHYTGWIRRGEKLGVEFGDSRGDGLPREYTLADGGDLVAALETASLRADPPPVIPGWAEILTSMKKGERRWVIVPSKLAYGTQGYGRTVPPNSDLVFDLELVEFSE